MTTPEIVVLALGDRLQRCGLESVHGPLLLALADKCRVRQASNAREAFRLFDQNQQPDGILVADPGIINAGNRSISRKLADYVRNGGTLVLGGMFGTNIRPNDLTKYLPRVWGLPWAAGSYHRTTLYLNQQAIRPPPSSPLPFYSQKAVFLKHVDPGAAWYVASESSVVESLVPLPGPGVDIHETPVAFSGLGNGWIGYVGDVNGEQGTDAVVLAMFGLSS